MHHIIKENTIGRPNLIIEFTIRPNFVVENTIRPNIIVENTIRATIENNTISQ